jgi:hypothetical protein
MAYALAAFARPRLTLANPGIMTGLYPRFWALYNALPGNASSGGAPQEAPQAAQAVPSEHEVDAPKRRRVRIADVSTG